MFRFTIRDVLWLTVVVAAFFGGRYWDQATRYVSQPPAPALTGTPLRLTSGRSGSVSTPTAVNRLLSSDPSVISIVPMTPTKFQVLAKAKGKSTVTVWEAESGRQLTYDIVVDP